MKYYTMKLAAAALALFGTAASAATVGPGGFDNGFATTITYDDTLTRSTSNGRHNALNSLGAADGNFFELRVGETVDFTFGEQFVSPGGIVEVTFGNPRGFFETVNIFAGTVGGSFVAIDQNPLANVGAQGADGIIFTFAGGPFDVLRMTAISSPNNLGGFDVDSVRVTPALAPVPLPAGGVLLVTALAGIGALKRRKKAQA